MSPNNYDLEELLQRCDFEGLNSAEREFVLREFGSAERYDCARTTLEHLPAALKFEEDMLELDPNLLVGINQRLDERARPWYLRAIEYLRTVTPRQMAYSGTGMAMIIFVGLTIGISGSSDFARNGLHLSADPADTLIEMFADSGTVQPSDVDVDDSLLSLRSAPVRQDLVYAAFDQHAQITPRNQKIECNSEIDLAPATSNAGIGLAAITHIQRGRRSYSLQSRQTADCRLAVASSLFPGAGTRAGPHMHKSPSSVELHLFA